MTLQEIYQAPKPLVVQSRDIPLWKIFPKLNDWDGWVRIDEAPEGGLAWHYFRTETEARAA